MNTELSTIATEVNRAMFLICGVSLLLLIGVTAAMIYFVIRFRRSTTTTTRQFKGNTLLEITWIVIPTIIVTWMFFVGYEGFKVMRTEPENAMTVEVTGKRWAWSFHYPDEQIDSREMYIPIDRPIKVKLHAPVEDVIHSFYIPDFRLKEDVVPGMDTWLWFDAKRPGTYNIFCAEFCGKDHAQMITLLHALPQEEYDAWVRQKRLNKYRPLEYEVVTNPEHPAFGPDDLNIDVETIYKTYCLSCHGAEGDGSGLPDEARDFRNADDWKRNPKITEIYRTLMVGVEDSQMRAYPNFTPYEKVALGHYVRAFMTDPPKDSQEDYDALIVEYELDKRQAPKESLPIEKAMDILVEEAIKE